MREHLQDCDLTRRCWKNYAKLLPKDEDIEKAFGARK